MYGGAEKSKDSGAERTLDPGPKHSVHPTMNQTANTRRINRESEQST